MAKAQLFQLALKAAVSPQELCSSQVIHGSHALLKIWQLHLLYCCTSLHTISPKVTILPVFRAVR